MANVVKPSAPAGGGKAAGGGAAAAADEQETGACLIDLNCGLGSQHGGSLTIQKFMDLSNIAASLAWLGAAHWFLPELQGDPRWRTYPACNLFMAGIGLFYMTSFWNLFNAFRFGAPDVVKFLLALFIVALCFFFSGVLGFYPEQAWGAHPATKMLMTAMSLAIFIYNAFIVLTIMACKAAGTPYWPILPFIMYQATIICFLAATVIFDEIFDGKSLHPLHDTYVAVFVFKGGAYLFPPAVLCATLFPSPQPPPPE